MHKVVRNELFKTMVHMSHNKTRPYVKMVSYIFIYLIDEICNQYSFENLRCNDQDFTKIYNLFQVCSVYCIHDCSLAVCAACAVHLLGNAYILQLSESQQSERISRLRQSEKNRL